MQYILLIYANEADFNRRPKEELGKMSQEYMKLTEEMKTAGQYRAGERLEQTGTATTVRVRDGKPIATDGPFAETREQLGGYYIIEAKDLDEAVSVAGRIPGARIGSIEVRPIFKMG
ncbi:MAG TPA: YciI family protein [Polyangiales bacterium]|nr:YciI family protein [Polyangiales bacterium]